MSPSDFSGKTLLRDGQWVVAFGAEWCPFCRDFRRRYEKQGTLEGATTAWADVSDTDNPLWEAFNLDVIPTVVVFRDGQTFWRRDGVSMKGLSDKDLEDLRKVIQ